jgi:uncharacterized protein YdeI (YjbR/CyaY-like superfamily)
MEIEIRNTKELSKWMLKNHLESKGVWLILYKKNTPDKYIPYDEFVRVLLIFGWIDSRPGKLDENRYKHYVTPRKPKSGWSKVNKKHIKELTKLGLMKPAGLAAVEIAKENGSWNSLDQVEELVLPQEFPKIARKYPGSLVNFKNFPPSARKAILLWIYSAKSETTKVKRIEKCCELAAKNIRANEWTPKNK